MVMDTSLVQKYSWQNVSSNGIYTDLILTVFHIPQFSQISSFPHIFLGKHFTIQSQRQRKQMKKGMKYVQS